MFPIRQILWDPSPCVRDLRSWTERRKENKKGDGGGRRKRKERSKDWNNIVGPTETVRFSGPNSEARSAQRSGFLWTGCSFHHLGVSGSAVSSHSGFQGEGRSPAILRQNWKVTIVRRLSRVVKAKLKDSHG